jgi:hypothetical protein
MSSPGGGLQHRGAIGTVGLAYTRPAATAGVGAEYRLNRIALSGEWRIAVVDTRAGREAIMPVLLGVRLPVFGGGSSSQTSAGHATSVSPQFSDKRGTIGTWLGYAPTTWSSEPLGGTPDRGLVLAGLRCTWPISGNDDWQLDYTADLLPAAVMTRTVLPSPKGGLTGRLSAEPRGSVYGFGAVPLGLSGQRRLAGAWWATLDAGTGMVAFVHDVPLPGARKLNFLLTGGLGLQGAISPRGRLRGGVRLDHLSNASSGYYNPGANFLTLYLGVARPR